jgi:hypothetical protein
MRQANRRPSRSAKDKPTGVARPGRFLAGGRGAHRGRRHRGRPGWRGGRHDGTTRRLRGPCADRAPGGSCCRGRDAGNGRRQHGGRRADSGVGRRGPGGLRTVAGAGQWQRIRGTADHTIRTGGHSEQEQGGGRGAEDRTQRRPALPTESREHPVYLSAAQRAVKRTVAKTDHISTSACSARTFSQVSSSRGVYVVSLISERRPNQRCV